MSVVESSAPLTSGAFVFWDVKPASHQRLRAELEAIGIGDYTPCPLSVTVALKRAMAEYARATKKQTAANQSRHTTKGQKMRRDKMVQRHASADKYGFEVVDVERGETSNVYVHDFSAKIVFDKSPDGETVTGERVSVTGGYANESFIQSQYNANRKIVSASAVGKMLVRCISELHGTCVRTMGGTYYVPEDTCPTWKAIVAAVERASETVVTTAKIVMDRSAVRTVKAAIQKEIKAECERLEQEIAAASQVDENGNPKMGKRALENRVEKGRELLAKVQEYESIVGEELQSVRNLLARVEQSAVAAIAKQQADDQFADLLTI